MCFFFFSAFKHRDLSLHVYGKKRVCLLKQRCLSSLCFALNTVVYFWFLLFVPPSTCFLATPYKNHISV